MIIYSTIYRTDGVLLAECISAGTEGNFRQATEDVIEFLMKGDDGVTTTVTNSLLADGSRRTFVHENEQMLFCGGGECLSSVFWYATEDAEDKNKQKEASSLPYYFQIFRKDGCVFLCISDDISGRMQQVNFSFLDEIYSDFSNAYSKQAIRKATETNSFTKPFSPKFRTAMHKYNCTNGNSTIIMDPKVATLHTQIDDLKNVMGYNIKLVLKREENINDLLSKASQLEVDASVFQKKSICIKKVSKKQYYRTQIFCFAIVLLLAIFLYLLS